MTGRIKIFLIVMLAVVSALLVGCVGSGTAVDSDAVSTDNGNDIISVFDTAAPALTASLTLEPTATPAPTEEPTATPLVDPNPDLPYYLYVEKGSFTLTIYSKDESFEYTVIERQYRIGHGGNKTPTGTFLLTDTRERWHTFRLGGSVQYATAYYGNLYIHSPLYGSENPWHLWPSYYNGQYGIGTANTGGCLRMVTEAAKFIYDNCPVGTLLEIVNGNPKNTTSPDVPEIITYGYDPTDIEANNGEGN